MASKKSAPSAPGTAVAGQVRSTMTTPLGKARGKRIAPKRPSRRSSGR